MRELKRRFLLPLSLVFMLFMFCGCDSDSDKKNNTEDTEKTTGYESGTIQFQTVMVKVT